jgi:hypothetical protein
MEMTHIELVRTEQESARKAEKAARRAKGLYEIYKNYPLLIDCDANTVLIDQQLGDDVTLDNFAHDFNASPEFRNKLAMQTPEQAQQQAEKTKRNLVNAIVTESYVSPDSANAFAKQLFYLSLPELEQKLATLREKQKLAELPKQELKAIVRADADAKRESLKRQYPFIPLEVQTREIKRMPLKELKELVRVHGQAQVDARLNGSDHKQQEEFLKQGFNL